MTQITGQPLWAERMLARRDMAGTHPRVRDVRARDARRIVGRIQDFSETKGWGPSFEVMQMLGSLHAILHEGDPFDVVLSMGQSNDAEGTAPGLTTSILTTPRHPYTGHTIVGTNGAAQGDEDTLASDGRPSFPVATATRTAGALPITITTTVAHGFTVSGGQTKTHFRTVGITGLPDGWYPINGVTATTITTEQAGVTTALSANNGSVTRNRERSITDLPSRLLEPGADDPFDAPRVISTRIPALLGGMDAIGRPPRAILYFAAGEGAEKIESFLPGTSSNSFQKPDPREGGSPYNYLNLITPLAALRDIALRDYGRDIRVRAVYFTQGEGGALVEASYKAFLDELQTALATDIHAITGQVARGEPAIKMFIVQTSNARERASSRDIRFPYTAHLELPVDFPARFIGAGTMTRGRLQSSSDAHPTVFERCVLAGAHMQAYIDEVELGIGWQALRVASVAALPSNVYRLTYIKPPRLAAVPLELRLPAIPPLVNNNGWRTTPFAASPLPNHGFSLIGPDAPDVRVTGVATVAGGNAIDVTLSGPVTSTSNDLAYAELPREWIAKIATISSAASGSDDIFTITTVAAIAGGALAVGDYIGIEQTTDATLNELGAIVTAIDGARTTVTATATSAVAGTPSGTGGVLYAMRFTPWLPCGTGSVCIRDTRTNFWNTIYPADVAPEIDHGALRQRIRLPIFTTPFGALAGLSSLTWMVGASPAAQITQSGTIPTVSALKNQKTGAATTDLFVQATAARQPGFIATAAGGGIAAAVAADEAVIRPFFDTTTDSVDNPTARWMTGLTTGVLSSGAWTMMITARPSAATSGWLFSEATNASGDDHIGGRFLQSGNVFQLRSRTFTVGTAGVTIGNWYCLIFERTAAGLISIRINGVNSAAVDASSLTVTAQPFTLFALGPVQTLPFVGDIRRVAFVNGVAGITTTTGGEVAAFEAEAKAAHPTVFTF